jgi:hypothetical protein
MFSKSAKSASTSQSVKKKKKSPERDVVNQGDDLIDIRSSLGGNSDFDRAVETSMGSNLKNASTFKSNRRLVSVKKETK